MQQRRGGFKLGAPQRSVGQSFGIFGGCPEYRDKFGGSAFAGTYSDSGDALRMDCGAGCFRALHDLHRGAMASRSFGKKNRLKPFIRLAIRRSLGLQICFRLHSPLLLSLSKSLENPLSIFRFPGLFIQDGRKMHQPQSASLQNSALPDSLVT